MLVKQRMSHPVITIHPETSMQDALELMRKEHIRRLPVVNRRGQLVGIVSETDLLKASPSDATSLSVWEVRELLKKVKIEEIMTRDVVTIDGATPLEEAARIMADSKISGLPVLQDGKLVGLITETDLFKTFLEMFGARSAGVRMTVLVPQVPGQLANLTKVVYDLGGDFIALGTFQGENSETAMLTFKIAGVSLDDLVAAVTPVVSKILDVR